MQTTALRLLFALALSGAVACGDDPSGSGDGNSSNSNSAKGDEDDEKPIKTVKKDAGVKKDAKVAADDEESDDEGDDEVVDAGKRSNADGYCEEDSDCDPPKGSGISCCDVPTNICYTWRSTDECPAGSPAMSMPEYN